MGHPQALGRHDARDPARPPRDIGPRADVGPRATRASLGFASLRALRACWLAVSLCATACASLPAPLDRPFREPGQKLADFPEAVAHEYGCAKHKLPWFKLEELEVWPKRVQAGGQLGHRMVYVLCTGRPTDVVTGRLETRILHRGKSIVDVPEPGYDLRPGRWVVDVFVAVPPQASDGIYALELAFKSEAVRFTRSETFVIEAAAK